ncbi:hypothetical protein AB0B85_17450 [Micromonospora sp. NPDC049044]|uniref:hypothetical protein n=1 Tax=unclassified Micromonospora TaxID=2617518 RepID=UPI0034106FD9
MRPTIVLLTPTSRSAELIARLRTSGSYQPGEIFDYLDRATCRFGLDFSGDVIQEFEEEEIAQIQDALGDFNGIVVEYSGVSCIRDLLDEVTEGIDGMIDTNFGEILRFSEVRERFAADPSWDWRH